MTPAGGSNGSGGLPPGTLYRVEWILGEVPMDPFEYARLLGRAWLGRPTPGLSLRIQATVPGQVKISLMVRAWSATEAMGRWSEQILSEVRYRGLEYPGYVLAWASRGDTPVQEV